MGCCSNVHLYIHTLQDLVLGAARGSGRSVLKNKLSAWRIWCLLIAVRQAFKRKALSIFALTKNRGEVLQVSCPLLYAACSHLVNQKLFENAQDEWFHWALVSTKNTVQGYYSTGQSSRNINNPFVIWMRWPHYLLELCWPCRHLSRVARALALPNSTSLWSIVDFWQPILDGYSALWRSVDPLDN